MSQETTSWKYDILKKKRILWIKFYYSFIYFFLKFIQVPGGFGDDKLALV